MSLIFKMILIFKRLSHILFFLIFVAGCNPKFTPINSSKNIVIDGDDLEWNRAQYQKVSGTGLVYSMTQDERSIKILVKAIDQPTLRKIGLLGLNIWLDGTGKSKKEVAIRYPLGVAGSGMLEKMMSQRESFDRERLEGKGIEMLKKHPANEVGLIGVFDDTKEVYQYPIDALKIPIQISKKVISNQELIIEYSIPVRIIKKGKKDALAIGFEIEGINNQELIKKQMAGHGGERFQGDGAGRMAGRRMAMSGMSDKIKEFQELNHPVMAWSKFKWER
jgi:hypothetical protein